MSTNESMTAERLADARAALDEDMSQWGGEYGLELIAEVERLRALTIVDEDMVERAAREMAYLEPGEDWPSNHYLGGGPCGTRGDEYRDAMHERAREVIAIIFDTGEDA